MSILQYKKREGDVRVKEALGAVVVVVISVPACPKHWREREVEKGSRSRGRKERKKLAIADLRAADADAAAAKCTIISEPQKVVDN